MWVPIQTAIGDHRMPLIQNLVRSIGSMKFNKSLPLSGTLVLPKELVGELCWLYSFHSGVSLLESTALNCT